MNIFENKKVLFFATKTFGYEIEIKSKMEALGASVELFDERPSNSFLTKALIRVNRKLLKRQITTYYNNIITKVREEDFDYIFFLRGEAVPNTILKQLRHDHSHAKMILYLWDSIRNNNNALNNLDCFDKILSFDKEDVQKYGFIFRPLFYGDAYKKLTKETSFVYDALFVGTVHSDRYLFAEKIRKQLDGFDKTMCTYYFFQSIILYYRKKMIDRTFRKTKRSDFQFSSLSKEKLLTLVNQSFCLVDVQHPKQTGLTMRTIESLGACRKLITTNEAIKHYDFYNANNILVVDRKNPVIPIELWETPYQNLETDMYNKYSIESWLNDIMQ
ncbi:hypothetical protein AGMMS49525_06670 [Bacteroidia bacterium]|nr:hypothetical protein AGMMS49525_06670 [Bacteroidia bacterium]